MSVRLIPIDVEFMRDGTISKGVVEIDANAGLHKISMAARQMCYINHSDKVRVCVVDSWSVWLKPLKPEKK